MAKIYSFMLDAQADPMRVLKMIEDDVYHLASRAFRHRSEARLDDEFPPQNLNRRLEKSFADFLVALHTAEMHDASSREKLVDAYELVKLNVQKAEWSFQNQADPEAPNMPWGERTVTNDFDSPYSVKSFEAYVTPTGFGVVGFDKYGDRAMHYERTNNPAENGRHPPDNRALTAVSPDAPGAKSEEDMLELVSSMSAAILEEYQLPSERLTPAFETVAAAPVVMTPLSTRRHPTARGTPKP